MVYHRRKWLQRAATKVTKGDTSANHTPVPVLEDGISKCICDTCGKLAKRPTDLGKACTGVPVFQSTRYWRKDQARLEDFKAGRPLTTGRNKPRAGSVAQPVDPGRICRELGMQSQGSSQVQNQEDGDPPAGRQGPPSGRPTRKRPAPQDAFTPHIGPRVSAGQELARIFPARDSSMPPATPEAFPWLTRASTQVRAPITGGPPGSAQGTRPRSRSPRASAWTGAPGKHMEATRSVPQRQTLLGNGTKGTQAQAKALPKSLPRKRQGAVTNAQADDRPAGKEKQAKARKQAREDQLTPKEAAEQRKLAQQVGFAQIFGKHPEGGRKEPSEQGSPRAASGGFGPAPRKHKVQDGEATRSPSAEAQGTHAPGRSTQEGAKGVVLSTRYAQLAESMRAEEVATKADLDLADRIRDSWDKDSRNEDMAHRKQDWHAEKLRKISGPTASWAVPGDISAREIFARAGKHGQAAGQA